MKHFKKFAEDQNQRISKLDNKIIEQQNRNSRIADKHKLNAKLLNPGSLTHTNTVYANLKLGLRKQQIDEFLY